LVLAGFKIDSLKRANLLLLAGSRADYKAKVGGNFEDSKFFPLPVLGGSPVVMSLVLAKLKTKVNSKKLREKFIFYPS
jgi:hypothetical protein